MVTQLLCWDVNVSSLKLLWQLSVAHSDKHLTGLVISMATQFQGPQSDPHVSYKRFWQEPPQPMHEDDLILQACHYQPSHVRLKPSFSPCEYFPSPWKERARWSERRLVISCSLNQIPLNYSLLEVGHTLPLSPMPHLHSTSVVPV